MASFRIVVYFIVCALLLPSVLLHAASNTDKLKYAAQQYYWGKGVKKNQTKALELYIRAAEQGDTEAQYIAGGMLYKGYGAPRNLQRAFSLLYGAALKGSSTPQSQKVLGQFFLTGSIIPKNYTEAVKWYKLAAENGDRESQSELAFLYFTGRGVERDLKKAFYWYQKSAYRGLAVAQYSLGIMYYSGSGVKKPDLIQSYGWLSLAASQNHRDSIISRDYIETTLSPDELKRAQDYSIELFQQVQSE